MRIRIMKEHEGYRLLCTRRNGSVTQGALGTGLPYHELAHYAVERELRMTEAYFGQIAAGRSMDELNDPAVIGDRPRQALEADVITINLLGLANGAVAQSRFSATVETELQRLPHGLTNEMGTRLIATYTQLLNAWEQVAEGAALELQWPG